MKGLLPPRSPSLGIEMLRHGKLLAHASRLQEAADAYRAALEVLSCSHGASSTMVRGVMEELSEIEAEMRDGAEMAPSTSVGPFGNSPLFLGGDAGRDTVVMVHGEHELPGATHLGHGVYKGGLASAIRAVEEGALPPDRFKFFYKSNRFKNY